MLSSTRGRMPRRRLLRAAAACLLTAAPAGGALFGPPAPVRPTAPPGHAAWSADGRRLPDPRGARPSTVRRYFAKLDDEDRRRLVRDHPGVLGNLDGAPIALRLAANRRTMAAAGAPYAGRRGRFLVFDPRTPGRIARVFGDLANAGRIAVLVPGAGNRADNFWYGNGGHHYRSPVVQAGDLFRAGSELLSRQTLSGRRTRARRAADPARTLAPERFAVIAWLGYRTPAGFDGEAVRQDLALAGAAALNRFVDGLVATCPSATVALLGHSYGSTVTGLAASRLSPTVTDIAVFGSPGLGVRRVDELGTDARVWAGESERDWIRWVPGTRLLGLGHGVRPADPAFGARTFGTTDVREHNRYLRPGTDSLEQLASIAAVGALPGKES